MPGNGWQTIAFLKCSLTVAIGIGAACIVLVLRYSRPPLMQVGPVSVGIPGNATDVTKPRARPCLEIRAYPRCGTRSLRRFAPRRAGMAAVTRCQRRRASDAALAED